MDENGEFIITALIVGAIIGAYIGDSQANGIYSPFKWDFNNVDTWIGMVGGVSGGVAAYAGGLAAAELAAYGSTGGVIGGAVAWWK